MISKTYINQQETAVPSGCGRNITQTPHVKGINALFSVSRFFDAILSPNIFAFAFKCSLLLLAISICCLQPSSANVFFSEEQLKTAVPVEFAAKNKALLVIVIPQNPKDIEKQAADLLAKYLGEITGAKFDIVAGDVPQTQHIISLGRTEAAKKAGFTDEQMRCPDQGYKIFVKDGSIYIFGGMRKGIYMGMNGTEMGLFYGTSALLEEDLGVRLYTDKWSVIPHDENLTARIVPRSDKPDFSKRLLLTYKGICENIPWSNFNRVFNNNGFDHLPFWFANTYYNILPRSEFSVHPERFAKDANGNPSPLQLCPSNPDIEKIALEKMLAALKEHHEPGTIIDLSHNDKECYCQCPACRKLNEKYGAEIGAHLEFVTKIANQIGKVYPDVVVDFLIYREFYSDPPSDKIKMPENTSGWYTVLPPSEAYFRKNKLWVKRMEGWQKVVSKVYMWDNSIDFGFYYRTLPVIAAKADNLRFWKEHKIPGVLILDAYTGEVPWGPMHTLRSWVLNKLLWNSSLNYDELAKDFCYGVFGKCGPEAYEYYQLAENPCKSGKTIEEYGLQKYFNQSNVIIKRAYAKAAGDAELTKRLDLYFFGVLFAQLEDIYNAYPKNKDNFPTKRYKELYTKVTEVVKEWDIDAYNECMRMESKLNDMGLLLDPAWDGSLKAYARYGIIYYGMLRPDPLVNNQLVGKLPPDGDWLVQWHYPAGLLIPGKKYQLRVELRLEEKPKERMKGYFEVGMSDVALQEKIRLSDIPLTKYRFFNIGKPVVPGAKAYVYFALSNGSNLSGVYVNRVELIPVDSSK